MKPVCLRIISVLLILVILSTFTFASCRRIEDEQNKDMDNDKNPENNEENEGADDSKDQGDIVTPPNEDVVYEISYAKSYESWSYRC